MQDLSESSLTHRLSVVVPVRNEADNIAPLLTELESALTAIGLFEVIYVDDGSTDTTPARLAELQRTRPWLRVLRHEKSTGQSAAVRSGVRAARAPVIATLDGDGQNDPAFVPRLYEALLAGGKDIGLAQGQRVGRKDTWSKRMQSRIANRVRRWLLKDGTRDTGCGLKVFRRDAYLALPYFDAIHRFMPALMRRENYGIVLVDVIDRPRLHGVSNYGFWNRLWVGLVDMAGVRWLLLRKKPTPVALERHSDAD